MGNRATIEVVNHKDATGPAYIYVHWHGDPEEVASIVRRAAPRMRKSDAMYSTARLIGELHNTIEGALSLGVMEPVVAFRDQLDNGHYIVDLGQGTIDRIWGEDENTIGSALVAEGLAFYE